MYIEKINGPADVKKLTLEELPVLAGEIRQALLVRASKHGGHFGPNFGMVEATIAMHYVFESPKDKIVYDVSHQSYPHKMLTGRKDAYLYEEHYDDVSGYSNPGESEHDHFTIGHTSTSISLALGLAKARDLKEENGNVIAVIGDGSLSGGEALEGLDYAAELGGNLIIVVNDNDMSIAENHGGLYENLKALRETNGESKCNLFKAMGLDYIYVKEGNKVADLIEAFKQVKDTKKAVVVHINTQKGKGYKLAEEHKEDWHYCAPFDVETGKPLDSFDGEDFSSVTAQYLLKKMKEDKKVVAITSATPTVMGFTEDKRKEAGKQFIDVGIAEETAMAMAAGIAAGGGKPVYGVYSTFVQRTYDQITQDLCIDSNAATIVTFWGSVYGMNDVTDSFIANLMAVNAGNKIGDDTTPIVPTKEDAYDYLVDMGTALTEANVPLVGRWAVVPAWYHAFLLKDDRFIKGGTDYNKAIIEGGEIGTAAGFTVYLSNNVPNTAGAKYKILGGVNMATSFAEQLVKVEAYRPEKSFADAVKGLNVYGSKVLQKNALVCMTVNKK